MYRVPYGKATREFDLPSDVVGACKMTSITTIEGAQALVAGEWGSALGVSVVPHALLTLPAISGAAPDG